MDMTWAWLEDQFCWKAEKRSEKRMVRSWRIDRGCNLERSRFDIKV